MSCAVDAERAAAHIGAVEIELQDLVLAETGLQPDRQERLVDLALDGALVRQEQVFRQLLGDRRTTLAHAAGLGVGDQRAEGAADIDAEMIVEAAVLGRERCLDQAVRKVLQRNRVVMLDAAAADRIAVAVEKGHREIRFLEPVFVGGLAEGGDSQRQEHDQAGQPQRRGLRQRLNEHPAFPAADIKAIHERRKAFVEFAQAPAGGEQAGIDACIEVQHPVLDPPSPFRWYDAHPVPLIVGNASSARPRHHRDFLLECCGKPKALLHASEIRYFVPERKP